MGLAGTFIEEVFGLRLRFAVIKGFFLPDFRFFLGRSSNCLPNTWRRVGRSLARHTKPLRRSSAGFNSWGGINLASGLVRTDILSSLLLINSNRILADSTRFMPVVAVSLSRAQRFREFYGPHDGQLYALANGVLEGKHAWLEQGIASERSPQPSEQPPFGNRPALRGSNL